MEINFDIIKYASWCYGARFLPSIVLLSLCHVMVVIDLGNQCVEREVELSMKNNNETAFVFPKNCSLVKDAEGFHVVTDLPQYFNFVFTFLYLTCISMSFVNRNCQIWQRHPCHNHAWISIVVALCTTMLFLTISTLLVFERYPRFFGIIWVWVIWFLGLILIAGINEVVKRQEIKVEVRHQKRERLEFGTKLGMNSPF